MLRIKLDATLKRLEIYSKNIKNIKNNIII